MRVVAVITTIVLCWLFSIVAADARPSAWCGWYMQQHTGVTSQGTGLNLNMAREWARAGSNAGGPGEGVVVVWPHHVGQIVGRAANGEWIVHSGNDGHAVRTRPRSLRGVIAFRHVGGAGSAYVDLKRQDDAARGRNKHLVALAVEGGLGSPVRPLKKSRAVANVAGELANPIVALGDASAFAPPAKATHKSRTKQRQPVMERDRMFVPLFAPVPEPVYASFSKQAFAGATHDAPRTRHGRAVAGRPSSQAWLQ